MFSRSDTVLFLDDAAIAQTVRLSRIYEQPKKFGPVVTPDRPWEGHCVIVYGSVLPHPDGKGYQMWYQTYSRPAIGKKVAYFCYATSTDGVNWEKPSLGQFEYDGSRDNNILVLDWEAGPPSTLSVTFDPNEPREERRYKMLFCTSPEWSGPGLFVAFSPDGISWHVNREPVCTSASDRTTLLHDPNAEVPFVAFTRRHGKEMQREWRGRVIYRIESEDFLTWSEPEAVLTPDLDDSWDVQFYGMPAFKYRDLYLGGLKRLWSTPDRIDTELVISRDTRTWRRTRRVFLPNGEGDAWDSAWIALASSPPIERDECLWFYHEGRAHAHARVPPFPRAAIGLAVLRKDHFAALEAGSVEGYVATRPFLWKGGRLLFTADARVRAGTTDHHVGSGSLRVEAFDADGVPIPKFARDEANPLVTGGDRWEPSWTSGATLDALQGRTIALRICLVNARLYALHREART